MKVPTTYDSSLPLREKVLYVLAVLKKESIGELSVEITELDGIAAEEGVAELSRDIEDEISRLWEEGLVHKLKEHRQKVRYAVKVQE